MKKISLLIFKFLSALIVAYLFSLTGKMLFNYGLFSFIFIFISILLSFLQLVRKYRFLDFLIIDLVIVIFILLARMFVIIAYGY